MRIYLVLGAALVLLLAYACDRTEQLPIQDAAMTQAPDFLTFESIDAFDAALNDPEAAEARQQKAAKFHSFAPELQTLTQEERLEAEGLEDFHASDRFIQLLNEHRMVQLLDWICQLDFKTKQAYVIHKDQWTAVQNHDLTTVDGVQTFSFEEDVVDYLEYAQEAQVDLATAVEGVRAEVLTKRRCNSVDGKKKEKQQCGDLRYNDAFYDYYSAKVKLVYQKAAVFFSVRAEVKNYKIGTGCNLHGRGDQQIEYGRVLINRKTSRRCRTDDFKGRHFENTLRLDNQAGDQDNSDAILRNVLYEGSRGLQDLDVTATFRYKAWSQNTFRTLTYRINE